MYPKVYTRTRKASNNAVKKKLIKFHYFKKEIEKNEIIKKVQNKKSLYKK